MSRGYTASVSCRYRPWGIWYRLYRQFRLCHPYVRTRGLHQIAVGSVEERLEKYSGTARPLPDHATDSLWPDTNDTNLVPRETPAVQTPVTMAGSEVQSMPHSSPARPAARAKRAAKKQQRGSAADTAG